MFPVGWRRGVGVLTSGCAALVVLSACAGVDDRGPSVPPEQSEARASTEPSGSDAPTERDVLTASSMQSIADDLRAAVPCRVSDTWLDDLAFWDTMRGFDCLDGRRSTFIRVYAHAASVPQTLVEWEPTFGDHRTFVRGEHWYVIAAPDVIDDVTAPALDPRARREVGAAPKLTAEQDYLGTCAQYIASEGERYVDRPRGRNSDGSQYEELFPGVTTVLHRAVDALGVDDVRGIDDRERWTAALSAVGPRVKAACRAAYSKVSGTVQPVEGAR